jgi:hypothetical protein
MEAKRERQKKAIKDRSDKNETRNEPALFQYREIEIWMMEDGVQMYRWHNAG